MVGGRLALVFFVNLACTTFFLNALLRDRGALHLQLVNDYFFLFLTNSYISSVFNYFDLVYGVRLVRRWWMSRSPLAYSQKQLNLAFEGHPVDMALRYANILKTMHFTAFVVPFLPAGPLLALLGMGISYWVDKHLLLTRYVCRQKLSYKLARSMSAKLRYLVLGLALGNLAAYVTSSTEPRPTLAMFCLGVLFLVLAHCLLGRRLLLCFLCRQEAVPSELPYEQASQQFTCRYDQFHPALEKAHIEEDLLVRSISDRMDVRSYSI